LPSKILITVILYSLYSLPVNSVILTLTILRFAAGVKERNREPALVKRRRAEEALSPHLPKKYDTMVPLPTGCFLFLQPTHQTKLTVESRRPSNRSHTREGCILRALDTKGPTGLYTRLLFLPPHISTAGVCPLQEEGKERTMPIMSQIWCLSWSFRVFSSSKKARE
jgi:hypothetical protein